MAVSLLFHFSVGLEVYSLWTSDVEPPISPHSPEGMT